jgi:hypothetical protein
MESRKKPWTAEEDRKLLELRAAGRSTISIAAALKRRAGAVISRLSILRQREKETKIRKLKPMATFDPSRPAILHDRFTDKVETWTGEDAADYRESAIVDADGSVEWRGFVFDGWAEVLAG